MPSLGPLLTTKGVEGGGPAGSHIRLLAGKKLLARSPLSPVDASRSLPVGEGSRGRGKKVALLAPRLLWGWTPPTGAG